MLPKPQHNVKVTASACVGEKQLAVQQQQQQQEKQNKTTTQSLKIAAQVSTKTWRLRSAGCGK